MRRAPGAIVAAHKMVPTRRELYVEGPTDKHFLDWLVGNRKTTDVRVVEIDLVDLPGIASGGKKERLLHFTEQVENLGIQIKGFADADTDHIFERAVPSNVILTDNRDLEGYMLREDCIEKLIKLALLDDKLRATDILEKTLSIGRQIGLLRLMSEIDGLELAFQATRVKNYINVEKNIVCLKFENYLRALMQNADISLKYLSEILERHKEVADMYSHLDDSHLVHGKDAVLAIERLLQSHGLRADEAARLLRCSFERQWMNDFPSLKQAYDFLTL